MKKFPLFCVCTLLFVGTQLDRAEAWQDDVSSSFSLTNSGDTATVASFALATHTCIAIRVSAGSVNVEKNVSGSWTQIGDISATDVEIFEGSWTQVRVRATSSNSSGFFRTRIAGGSDILLGAGTVSLSGTPKRVYYSEAAATERYLYVTAGTSSSASVHLTSSGGSILDVEEGDTASTAEATTEYWLSGTGSADVKAGDAQAGGWSDWKPVEDNGPSDDDDPVHDPNDSGTTCMEYEIKNIGSVGVTIKYKRSAQNPDQEIVDPDDTFVFDCDMDYVEVIYPEGNDGGKIEWRHRKKP